MYIYVYVHIYTYMYIITDNVCLYTVCICVIGSINQIVDMRHLKDIYDSMEGECLH